MVDRRLQGERWQVPARLYARPLVLRTGMPMTVPRAGEDPERPEVRAEGRHPGRGRASSRWARRPSPSRPRGRRAAASPCSWTFEKDRDQGDARPPDQAQLRDADPRAGADHVPLRREPREAAHRPLRGVPDHVIKAVLAIEDRRFFSHPGLDPFRIVGAAVRNIAGRELHPGRQHHHPAAREELLPHPGEDASGARRRRRCSPSCWSGAPTRRTSSSCT